MSRFRWEIETGFRERGRAWIKTASSDFLMMLFFYVVSCIVYNI
jgi:IS4 transposase